MRAIRFFITYSACVFISLLLHDLMIHSAIASFMYHDFSIHTYVKIFCWLICMAMTVLPLLLFMNSASEKINYGYEKLFPLTAVFILQALCTVLYIFCALHSPLSQRLSYAPYLLMWALQDMEIAAVTESEQSVMLVGITCFQGVLFSAVSLLAYMKGRRKMQRVRYLEDLRKRELLEKENEE